MTEVQKETEPQHLPLFSKFDVCRPIRNTRVRDIVRRLIQASNKSEEVQQIVTELKADEKPDNYLIDDMNKYFKEDDWDGLIAYLKFKINELKYRSTGKFHTICKEITSRPEEHTGHPSGAPLVGAPTCATKKMDGTQVQIGIFADTDAFCMLSHNGNDLIQDKDIKRLKKNGAFLYKLEDLEPYIPHEHTKPIDREFQGGSLTKNFIPVIPQLQELVKDLGLQEAWFYFELTFAIGKRTPKGIKYDDDDMNRCYLFCMTYNLYDELNVPKYIVKLTVNSETKPVFDKYKIPTVNIVFEVDSFQITDFDTIMSIVNKNKKLEGVVMAQHCCYLKLVTHFFTEKVEKYPIRDNDSVFQVLQDIYHKYMEMREKPQKQKKTGINWKFVDEEFDKELSHDGWADDFRRFYSIPGKETQKVYDCVQGLAFTKKVLESLAKEQPDQFDSSVMTKKMKQCIIQNIIKKMVNNKKDIKDRFKLSSQMS